MNALEASKYLTKFSKLVRTILDNSKSSLISFEKELESLKLYIELEQMRFTGHFDYEFVIDPAINIHQFGIPPLLIQPFVENAIWHGLMHKKEQGLIQIELKELDQYFECAVIDNGVGRQFAEAKKKEKGIKKTSKGIKITENRLLSFDEHNPEPLMILDLSDREGKAIGTKVVFKIPKIKVSQGNALL
ncbi:MAG: histidine kinase [Bacteroidota bacterium]